MHLLQQLQQENIQRHLETQRLHEALYALRKLSTMQHADLEQQRWFQYHDLFLTVCALVLIAKDPDIEVEVKEPDKGLLHQMDDLLEDISSINLDIQLRKVKPNDDAFTVDIRCPGILGKYRKSNTLVVNGRNSSTITLVKKEGGGATLAFRVHHHSSGLVNGDFIEFPVEITDPSSVIHMSSGRYKMTFRLVADVVDDDDNTYIDIYNDNATPKRICRIGINDVLKLKYNGVNERPVYSYPVKNESHTKTEEQVVNFLPLRATDDNTIIRLFYLLLSQNFKGDL